jgi:hypothetical protein
MLGMDVGAVVIDPAIGDEARQSLAGLAADVLVPYREPVPVADTPRKSVTTPVGFGIAAAGFAGGFAAVGTSFQWSLNMIAPVTFCAAMVALGDHIDCRRKARMARHPAIAWHGRYVVPVADLDAESWPLWERAAAGQQRITGATVVRDDLVDSVQVAAVLPQRLWEIAERLALLSEARERQRDILGAVRPDDPAIAATLGWQRRAQDLATADITRRVADLEALGELFAAADAAIDRERIASELADLNDLHADLLARIGETAADAGTTERIAGGVADLIEQARAAVSRANAAAVALALPGEESPAGAAESPAESQAKAAGEVGGERSVGI